MAQTDIQQLTYALEIIESWQDGDEISEIESAFSLLDQVNRAAHKKELAEIRQALLKNSALNEPYLTRQLRIKPLARKGNWWWNPAEW